MYRSVFCFFLDWWISCTLKRTDVMTIWSAVGLAKEMDLEWLYVRDTVPGIRSTYFTWPSGKDPTDKVWKMRRSFKKKTSQSQSTLLWLLEQSMNIYCLKLMSSNMFPVLIIIYYLSCDSSSCGPYAAPCILVALVPLYVVPNKLIDWLTRTFSFWFTFAVAASGMNDAKAEMYNVKYSHCCDAPCDALLCAGIALNRKRWQAAGESLCHAKWTCDEMPEWTIALCVGKHSKWSG